MILPIQQEEFGISVTLQDQPDVLDIQSFYQDNAGNFWVALRGEEVVGTVALLDIGNGQGAYGRCSSRRRSVAACLASSLAYLRRCGAGVKSGCKGGLFRHHGQIPRCTPILREERLRRSSAVASILDISRHIGGCRVLLLRTHHGSALRSVQADELTPA